MSNTNANAKKDPAADFSPALSASQSSTPTRAMAQIALMTAVLCVLGPLSIPIGPVPISLGVFAVMLAACLLSVKKSVLVCLLYLLIGLAGLPVFAGFTGGAAKLAGPTGGYLIGYLPMVLIAGFFANRFTKKIVIPFLGMTLSLAVLYVFGSVWLAVQSSISLAAAFMAGVVPFIALDLIKIALAILLARLIRPRLASAGLLP